VIKEPEVKTGEFEAVTHGSYQSALPGSDEPIGWEHEPAIAYGFTDFLKLELALQLKQPAHEELETTAFGIASYLELASYEPLGVVFSVFSKVSLGLEEGVADSAQFGPLAKFGDDELNLTLNGIFDKTFGEFREAGTSFRYAAQLRFALIDELSAGTELFGEIPNIDDVRSFNETEFRIGPMLYFGWQNERKLGGSRFGLAADVGVLFGTTEATSGIAVKWDLNLSF
jgi:hypothetical protein